MAPAQITQLLQRGSDGDTSAYNQLYTFVYQELRQVARRIRRQVGVGTDQTLQTTALVHEVYLRLIDQESVSWECRNQFFGMAARAMRFVLIDYLRHKQAAKRGGKQGPISLHEWELDIPDQTATYLTDLHDALEKLEQIDARSARIVECRFFGGMTIEETASGMGLSPATVKRNWNLTRAWLYQQMKSS
ncbi:RNA polymerase sigma factor, TIGR02999 family [Catalinimonas alkaloidigena]|uniref:RNA polymerase sigma factor, TIGR02999 family n=1 Tax=Catalinimonas alkaloidigena TaxID=1075417 RepID=A0A1G8XDJ0_9BACT|nr:sigma-70 family RNA polymerase sigma factor [Catalinimonas alkaloidigena]SDJ88414.1 RNA polymerase sigma factor, TIGR02999 family [Catalinimonas alkaloidigena]